MRSTAPLNAIALAALLVVSSAVQAQAPAASTNTRGGIETLTNPDGSVARIDLSGHGAVLCTSGVLNAVRAVARACERGQDAALQAELDRSLTRIDGFIIANSHPAVSAAGLAARRAEDQRTLQASGDLCRGDAAQFYGAMRARGAEALRTSTDDLLSVAREPVMNPCL